MAATASIEDFGSDGYIYVRGDLQRYQTKRVHTNGTGRVGRARSERVRAHQQ